MPSRNTTWRFCTCSNRHLLKLRPQRQPKSFGIRFTTPHFPSRQGSLQPMGASSDDLHLEPVHAGRRAHPKRLSLRMRLPT